MTEEIENKSHSGGFIWVGAAVLIPLLYLLSIGPVLRVFKNSPSPPTGTLRSFYYPVVLLPRPHASEKTYRGVLLFMGGALTQPASPNFRAALDAVRAFC